MLANAIELVRNKRLGFTGSQNGMTDKQLEMAIAIIQHARSFTHGDCIGSDKQAHGVAMLTSTIPIDIHPPIDNRKRAFCWAPRIHDPKPYIERNHNIVDAVDVMLATPETAKEQLRSGTWATIRYTRKQRKPLIIINPNGEINNG